MVIRRKDGTPYKVRGPNKLLIAQEFWGDEDKLIMHNFDMMEKIILDANVLTMKPPVFPAPKAAPNPELAVEVMNMPPPPTDTMPVTDGIALEPAPERKSTFRDYDRCWFFCLPAEVTTVQDQLYNESHTKVIYKDAFRFQGAMIGSSDIRMAFWTTVDHVTDRSIIFHTKTRRWWEVQEVATDRVRDGSVFTCVPSQLKPDFSASSVS